jgi:hypothetical protein
MLPTAVSTSSSAAAQHVVVAPGGAQETCVPIYAFSEALVDDLSVPDASSPAASHSMRRDVHAEDETSTQQTRQSRATTM